MYIYILIYQIYSQLLRSYKTLFSKVSILGKSYSHPASYSFKINQKGLIKFSKHTLISYLIVSTVLVGSGIIFLFNPLGGGIKQAEAAWFNDNWSYRKIIPITANTGIDTASYVAVTLTNTNTLVSNGQLQSDCGDMRFTKFGGEILPYYISSGCNSASTVVHVYFDTLPAGASDFYFYYGNPSAVNGFSATAFSTAAVSVTVGTVGSEEKAPSPTGYWKFDDAQGTTAQDSTSNNYDGTLSGTPTWRTEDGCISGKCLRFSGSSQHVSTTTTGSLVTATAGTMSVWVKPRGTSPTATDVWDIDGIFADAGGDMGIYRGIIGGLDRIWIYNYDGNQDLIGITYNTNEWVQISWVHTGGTLYAYKNGNLISSTASGNTDLNNPIDIGKGMDAGANGTFEGDIDEVKIYRNGLSAAQILANYNARSNPEGVSSALGANTQNMPGALSNGLTGYWKMDESSWTGDCSTDSALDSSGNSLHGDACPNASAPSPGAGKFGNGGNFDGTNDYISIPDGSSVEPSGDMTLSAWVKFDTLPGAGVDDKIIFKDVTGSPFVTYELVYNGNGNFYFGRVNNSTTYEYASYTITAATNTWYHVIGVKRGDKVYCYVNSLYNESETDVSSGTLYNSAEVLSIGGDTGSDSLDGIIDEVRIYNRGLSSSEIQQLNLWAPGPVGYWKMDEKTGTVGADASGYVNNGTLGSSTALPTWTNGKYGSSLSFDGGDTFFVADSASLSITNGFSLSGWIKPTNVSGFKPIVTKEGGGQTGYFLYLNGANVYTGFGNSGFYSQTTSTAPITAGIWTHVASSWDGTTLRTYVNGVLLQSSTHGSTVADNSDNLGIGAAFDLSSTTNGVIDDVKVYNYARSQGQVVEDMNAGHPAPGSPVGTPLGYWKFDQGADNTCSGGTNDACNSGSGGTTYDGANTSSTWTQNGKFGKAYSYNGSSGRVDFGDFTALETATQASWSFWVRPTTLATSQALLVKANNAATQQSWSIMTDSSTSTAIRVRIASGATDQSNYGVTPTGVLANNTWAYVTVIYDGGQSGNASKLKVYVNGLPQTLTFTGTIPTTLQATTSSMRSGAWSDAGGTFFNGILDEMKVFTQPLTASQVLLDMNGSQAQVMGAISDSSTAGNDNASTRTAQSAASEYCIPGDASTCTAPVGRWNFEEGTGTTANDTSGNNRNLTLTNSPTYGIGKSGKGIAFSTSISDNDHLIRADDANFDFGAGDSFTIEGWFKPDPTIPGNQLLVSKYNEAGYQLSYGGTNATAACGIDYDSTWTPTDVSSTADGVMFGGWNHVACVKNANSSLTIYVNGQAGISIDTSLTNSTLANSGSLVVGINPSGAGAGTTMDYIGSADDIRIFNYARTPAQIAWDYNKGAPVGYWKMDECSGTSIKDSAGNSLTGTLTNAGTPGTCTTSGSWFNGVSGKKNYSMNFDGSDDNIAVSDNDKISIDSGLAQGFTFSSWVYPRSDGETDVGEIFDKGTNTFCRTNSESASRVAITCRVDLTTDADFTVASAIPINQWSHVAFSWTNDADDEVTIWINGVPNTSTATFAGDGAADANALTLGGTPNFDGQLDDFKIFNYELTTTQVKSLINDGATRYGPVTGAP